MSTKDEPEDGGQIIPFAQVLRQIARGSAHNELSTELQRLARAVVETEKKGSITLVVTVEQDVALRHGWRTLDHDDFNIGTFIDDRLVAFGWGDHDFGPDQDGTPHGGYDLAAIQQAVTP